MPQTPAILVTGGAGYIGSHVVKQLGARHERVVILDDLSTGFESAIKHGNLIVGDTGDSELISKIIQAHKIETVMHFAARTIVPESVHDPIKYYKNNTANTLNLLDCCQVNAVKHFIFSSTAAVYGMPESPECTEDTPPSPINPYGMSKLISEHMLRDLSQASPLRHVILRYFNVAGADPSGEIGQSTEKATLLIKVAVEAAVGKRSHVSIFGTDYPTADGTGIRDYIHVEDLAAAHINALDYLRNGGENITLNCGYGHGFSVREVLEAVERIANVKLDIRENSRRQGDPPALIARADRIKTLLNWEPHYDDLDTIVRHALAWEQQLMQHN